MNKVAFANGKRCNPKTEKRIVEEKLQILRDFCIVDHNNEDQIRSMLICAIHEHPNISPITMVDRIAKRLISEKLS